MHYSANIIHRQLAVCTSLHKYYMLIQGISYKNKENRGRIRFEQRHLYEYKLELLNKNTLRVFAISICLCAFLG